MLYFNKIYYMTKITIIIPVYNSEKTITKTLQSIIDQSFTNFEILIINDGSTDSTLNVISNIKDPRIRIISKSNSGVINAYIFGIKNSSSDYIMFCDSDDFYKDDFIENAYTRISTEKVDVVSFKTNYVSLSGKVLKTSKYGINSGRYSKEEIQKLLLSNITFNSFKSGLTHIIPVFRWNKIYTKELLIKVINDLNHSLKQLEDNVFTTSVLLNASSIFIDDRIEYDYVQQETSVSTGYKKNLFQEYEKSVLYLKRLFNEYNYFIDQKQFSKLIISSSRVILRRIAKNTNFNLFKSEFLSIVYKDYFRQIKFQDIDDIINIIFVILLKAKFSFLTYVILRNIF